MKQPRESDTQYVLRVQKTLGLTQHQMAPLLGIRQPALSLMLKRKQKLNPLQRAELDRRMAVRVTADVLANGQANKIPACRGHTLTDFDLFMRHIEICPMCQVRAYHSIVLKRTR